MANIRIKISSINKKQSDVLYSDIKTESVAIDETLINKQAIRNSVRNILSWRRGERCLFPEFGNKIHDYVFETLNSETLLKIQNDITAMLSVEPRIAIQSINVSSDIDRQTIKISVKYNIPILNTTDSITIEVSR